MRARHPSRAPSRCRRRVGCRLAENSSRVSVNSARSRTCTAPVAAQNACQAACSPPAHPSARRPWHRPRGDPPTVQDHHRHVLVVRRAAVPAAAGARTRGVSINNAMMLGLRVVERVVDVVGGVGDEFLSGRHREPVARTRACARNNVENAEPEWVTRLIPPGRQRIGLQVAERAHAERVVDEPHAARPAQRHVRGGRDRGHLVPQSVAPTRTAPPTARPPRRRPPAARPTRCRARRAEPGRPPRPGRRATAHTAHRRCGRSAGSPGAHGPNRVVPQ